MLQFKKKIGMVEWLTDEGQLGGIHSRRAHKYWRRSERGGAKRRKGELGSLGATGTLVVWENGPGHFIFIHSLWPA